jgi:hypothetical protein
MHVDPPFVPLMHVDPPMEFTSGTCKRPPPGWFCTGDEGHDGPCAAVPLPFPPAPETIVDDVDLADGPTITLNVEFSPEAAAKLEDVRALVDRLESALDKLAELQVMENA